MSSLTIEFGSKYFWYLQVSWKSYRTIEVQEYLLNMCTVRILFQMLTYNNILKHYIYPCVPAVITFVPAVAVEMDSPELNSF